MRLQGSFDEGCADRSSHIRGCPCQQWLPQLLLPTGAIPAFWPALLQLCHLQYVLRTSAVAALMQSALGYALFAESFFGLSFFSPSLGSFLVFYFGGALNFGFVITFRRGSFLFCTHINTSLV